MTSAGPSERRPNDIRPRKRRSKWGCVTSLEDGDEDRGDGLAALAVTRAGYGGHGPTEYAQAVPAPQSVGDAAHSPCEGAPYKLRRNEERPRSAGGGGGVQEIGFCTKGYILVISPFYRWYITPLQDGKQ